MGNSALQGALADPRAAELAGEMDAFDNLRVAEIEALWRAFYDYAASFALTRAQLRTVCCSAARALRPQASTAKATADADRAFAVFAQPASAAASAYARGGSGDSRDLQVMDALEFFSAVAFIAAAPLDDKIDLLFDSWDMSEDGELDLDEFTISLKSTLWGLGKIVRVRAGKSPTETTQVRAQTPISEDEAITLASTIFREIRMSATASNAITDNDRSETINCEQFRQYCTSNTRTKLLFALFDHISTNPIEDDNNADNDVASEWGRAKRSADDSSSVAEVTTPTDLLAQTDSGDEFLAVKPWKGAIVSPTKAPPVSREAPVISVKLDWVHGYSAQENSRNNVRFTPSSKSNLSGRHDEIIYPAAAVCVLHNTKTKTQRHLVAHTDDVLSLCVHPTLPIAASGEIGKQPKIVLWDLEAAEPICVLKGFHQRGVLLLVFLSTEQLVSVGDDEDHSIALYESKDSWKSAILKTTMKGNKAVPFSIATPSGGSSASNAKQFAICGQKIVDFWTFENGALSSKKGLLGKKGTQQAFLTIEFISKGAGGMVSAVVGTADGNLYQFSGRDLSAVVAAHKGPVTALYYAAGMLVSGGKDGKVVVWDDKIQKIAGPFDIGDVVSPITNSMHYKSVRSCCLSPDKRSILIGTEASEIYEIDSKSGKNFASNDPHVKGHFIGELWGMAVHPSKLQFSTVGDDKSLRIWDLLAHKELRSVCLDGQARACAYSPDGKMIAVGFGGAEPPRAASTSSKNPQQRQPVGKMSSTAGSGSTGRPPIQGGFVVYNEADLAIIKEPCLDAKKWVSDIKFSPDGRFLAVASHDCKMYVYDVLNGFSRRHIFKKHSSYLTHIDFSSDGNFIQSTCGAYELLFSEVQNGRHITSASTFRDERWNTMTCTLGWSVQGIWEPDSDGTDVNAVDRSKSGNFLATGDDFGKVKIFRYPCALEKASSLELLGHSSHVTNIRWGVGDGYIVSLGGNDRCVFVWRHDGQVQPTESSPIEIANADIATANTSRRRKSSAALVEFRVPTTEADEELDDYLDDNKGTDKSFSGALTDDPIGDEFMAVKPWLGAIVPPSNAKEIGKTASTAPSVQLELEHVHGYQSQNASNNARFDAAGRVVYHAATVGIVAEDTCQQAAPRQRFFRSHDDDIVALCAHPNGTAFASAQMGKLPKIFVWSSENCSTSVPCIEGFLQRFISAMCFSADGAKLGAVGGDDDHSIAIYSWQNGLLVASGKGERRAVRSICHHSSNHEWITCGERHIRFWKEQGKSLTSKNAIFGKAVVAPVFECVVSFGSSAVAAGSNGNLFVFQGSNQLSRTVEAHGSGPVFALSVTLDSGELISGGKDGRVVVWSAQFAKVVEINLINVATTLGPNFSLSNPAVRSVNSSRRSSRVLLVGTLGSDLFKLDASSNSKPTLQFVTRGHCSMELWGLACHPTRSEFCTVGDDQTARVWCSGGRTMLRMARLKAAARACAISPTGDLIALGYGGRAQQQAKAKSASKGIDNSGAVEIVSYDDLGKCVFNDKPSKQAISEIKFSPNGAILALGSHDHCIYLYRVQRQTNGEIVVRKSGVFNKHQSYITHLDFSADSQFVQSNCGAYELLFSRADSGKHVTSASSVKDVVWSSWTCILGWPVQGIWPPCSDGTDVNAVSRSGSGDLLASADDFGKVKLFCYPCIIKNAAGNEYRAHSSHVTNVRWILNDSKVISVGGLDRCVMQWNVLRSDRNNSSINDRSYSDTAIVLDTALENIASEGAVKEREQVEDDEMYTDTEGDEFMAVKPWIGAIVAPSNAPAPNAREPDVRVELEWVYGYQSASSRQNVAYNQFNEVVYHTAAVGVIYDASSHFQKHHVGHNDDITSFAISNSTRAVIATGERGKAPVVRLWDSHTGELRNEIKAGTLTAQARSILSLAFSSDNTHLVSVGSDDNHTVALWEDASNGGAWTSSRLVATVKGDRGTNMFAAFGLGRDSFITGGVKHILFWEVKGANSISATKGQVGKVGVLQAFPSGCAFSTSPNRNDESFVTGTASGELYVWKGNQLAKSVKAHEGEVRVVYVADSYLDARGVPSSVLLSGGKDGRVVVWNGGFQSIRTFSLAEMTNGFSFQCLNTAVNSICLRKDGVRLLVATCSSDIVELPLTGISDRSIDLAPASLLASGHFAQELWGLAVHPLRRYFVTTGDDATLRVWDMDARRMVNLSRLRCKARACAFSNDGELIAVGFGGDNGGVGRRRPAVSKSNNKGATQTSDGAVALFAFRDILSGQASVIFEDRPAKEWISDVKFSPNDSMVAFGSHDNAIYLYSIENRDISTPSRVSMKKRKPFAKHNSYITHLDFSADGAQLQSNCGAYELLFCDTSTSDQVRSASSLKNTQWATWTCVLGWPVQGIWPACADGTDVNSVCASKSRSLLASGDDNGLLKVFRYPCVLKGVSGECLHAVLDHMGQ